MAGVSLHHQKYCWWKKSCTTGDVQNPVNNGIYYLWNILPINWCRISSINSRSFSSPSKVGSIKRRMLHSLQTYCMPQIQEAWFKLPPQKCAISNTYIIWAWPPPSNSDHQNQDSCLVGRCWPVNPSKMPLLLGGAHPKYNIQWVLPKHSRSGSRR